MLMVACTVGAEGCVDSFWEFCFKDCFLISLNLTLIRKMCLLMLPLCYGLDVVFVLGLLSTCLVASFSSPSVFVFKSFGRYGVTEGAVMKVCAHVGEYMVRGSCVLVSSCLGSVIQDGKCVGFWLGYVWCFCLKVGSVSSCVYVCFFED